MHRRRLKPHHRNQLELKLSYPIDRSSARQSYTVETYIFISRRLGLLPGQYGAEDFFGDASHFIRMQTPREPLAALAKGEGPSFEAARASLKGLRSGASEAAVREGMWRLRLLGCVLRVVLAAEGERALSGPEEDAEAFMDRLGATLEAMRALLDVARAEDKPGSVREVADAVDEYVTFLAEGAVTPIAVEADGPLAERAGAIAVEAFQYRQAKGWQTVYQADDGEALPYRRGVLKRVVSSALHLDAERRRGDDLANDITGMFGAAAAMLFAVLVALWAQARWDMFTGAFVGAMVGSYIVKDRIKEWNKRYIAPRMTGRLPDRVTRIRDAEGAVIGNISERVRLVEPEAIDDTIVAQRHLGHPTAVEEMGRPEVVLHHIKKVHVETEALRRSLDCEGLTDVLRLNLRRLRERMDAPREEYRYVDPVSFEPRTVSCPRVYHLNVVLRINSHAGSEFSRLRVILDATGLQRVESLSTDHEHA